MARPTVAAVLKEVQAQRKELKAQRLMLADVLSALSVDSKREQAQEKKMAKTLAEIEAGMKAADAKMIEDITAQTTLVQGVKVFIEGQAARSAAQQQQIKELLQQLKDQEIDTTALEAILASMEAADAQRDANAKVLADALAANAEPVPE